MELPNAGMLGRSATAFVTGVLTLGIEIVVGRLLAPFFGSSLYQWAAMIGVALLAYALGYWIYERLTRFGVALPLAVGGVYVLSLPFWLHETVTRLLFLPMAAATVVSAILAIGAPSLVWACVLPQMQKEAGAQTSSRMLAWSAGGNLAGAWGVAFITIPFLGTKTSLLAIGVSAIVLGLAWVRARPGLRKPPLIPMGLCILAGALLLVFEPTPTIPQELLGSEEEGRAKVLQRTLVERSDSPYQTIEVWDETTVAGTRRALLMNGTLQFLWSRREPLTGGSRFQFYNYLTAAALWGKEKPPRNVLILGLGGGLVHWQLQQYYPGLEIVSFELDPVVAAVARRALPLSETRNTPVRIGDGRILLQKDTARYDVIVLDTYLNSYVPFHLTTREFFEVVAARLAPGGILVANFHSVFAASGLLAKLEATIRSVFPTVGAIGLASGTTLVVASAEETDLARQMTLTSKMPAEIANLSEDAAAKLRLVEQSTDGSLILTDDKNDTEQRLYQTRKYIREFPRPLAHGL